MAEQWTVKQVEAEEPKSKQEQEEAVLEKAVESGDVAPEYGVKNEDGDIKINLDAPPPKQDDNETPTKDDEVVEDGVAEQPESAEPTQEQKEVPEEAEAQENAIELITDDEDTEGVKAATATAEQQSQSLPKQETPRVLPEDVDKLVSFMEETGGTVEDYVALNRDITKLDDTEVIKEYYRQKHPHLSEERLERKMKKSFSYDEELDEPDLILDKKDAFEDETHEARKFLEGRKEKYYADLKLERQNNLPPETQEAVQYFEQYKTNLEQNQKLVQTFHERTDQVFNEDFKGFDFKVGDNKYRYKVEDSSKVKESQLDLNNFVKEFLGEDGTLENATGYHKALWSAKNADKIAKHFYEQGRAEAIKEKVSHSKGINMDPRKQVTSNDVRKSGAQVRAVQSDDSSKLRFKNYKNR